MEFGDIRKLGVPVYKVRPYVILSKENVVLASGTLEELISNNITGCGYYDDCTIEVRKHDLYLNDNTKVSPTK